jgi:uncharacterized protein YciI
MAYFAVTREHGPGWDPSRPMLEQDEWDAHALLMDAMAAEGLIVLGGPLGDGDHVLLIIDAETEAEIEARLAEDPWTTMGLLRTVRVEPWQVLLRGGRLTGADL